MNPVDAIPLMLGALFVCVVALGGAMVWLVIRLKRAAFSLKEAHQTGQSITSRHQFNPCYTHRPPMWLAIRSENPLEVQEALLLDDPVQCSWIECMDGENTLFITPPVNGWLFVIGTDLPDPSSDVDKCFHFLTALSRKLGRVQLFQADPLLHHHAWVEIEWGRVKRAYAWAETTLWNQGLKTASEIELDLKCFPYGADCSALKWRATDLPAANVDKVSLLARRWSLDPATVEGRILAQPHGIAGKASRLY
jgi:hypothetical protein